MSLYKSAQMNEFLQLQNTKYKLGDLHWPRIHLCHDIFINIISLFKFESILPVYSHTLNVFLFIKLNELLASSLHKILCNQQDKFKKFWGSVCGT